MLPGSSALHYGRELRAVLGLKPGLADPPARGAGTALDNSRP